MKRKKTAEKTAPAAQEEKTPLLQEQRQIQENRKENAELIGFFFFALAAVFVTSGWMTCLLMLLCIAFGIRKTSRENLKEHLSLPVIGLIGMILIYGISGIAAPHGAAVEQELFRGMAAFAVAAFALLRFRKKHVPALLWGLSIVIAAAAFVSLDGGATGILFRVVRGLVTLLGGSMSNFEPVQGQRLAGIVNNANTMAGITALGMLLGLHQIKTEACPKKRFAAAFLLGLDAMVFWLCLSRGAILCFAAALLVYLLLTRKGERLELFLLMAVSAGTTVVLGFFASALLGKGSLLPDLLGIACGPVIFLLCRYAVVPLAGVLQRHTKAIWISGAVAAVACAAYVVAALQIVGPYTLHTRQDAPLSRVVDLTPGETYTVSGDWDGDLRLRVHVRNRDDVLMNRYVTIYDGYINGAEFSVPEDTVRVLVQIFAGTEQELREVTFSDGTEMKLDYRLLPESIAARLQDPLATSTSLLLRIQYVKDALALWKDAPIFGRGLASTDSLYPSVQPFFYATKYVHNHVIQYLADIGLAGVAFFLLIVGGLIWMLLRNWKAERDPLAAVFLACMVMIHAHGLMEVTFSIRSYLIVAYLLMAIMTVFCGEALQIKGKAAAKRAVSAAMAGLCLCIAVFACVCTSAQAVRMISARKQFASPAELMSSLEKYIALDALDDAYYMSVYMARGHGNPAYQSRVDRYALALRNSGVFTNCDAVARYYYLPMGAWEDVFACTREGIATKASDPQAWNGELDFYRATVLEAMKETWEEDRETFVRGVMTLADWLADYNDWSMDPIVLSEDNQAFLSVAAELAGDPSVSAEEAYERLSQYSEAESEW